MAIATIVIAIGTLVMAIPAAEDFYARHWHNKVKENQNSIKGQQPAAVKAPLTDNQPKQTTDTQKKSEVTSVAIPDKPIIRGYPLSLADNVEEPQKTTNSTSDEKSYKRGYPAPAQ